MNYGPNQASYYQSDPEKIRASVQSLILKASDAKRTIEELLFLLDMQEKVPWPDMLEKFSSLAAAMSQLQGALRKSALPSGQEDHGVFLRSNVMVPQMLSLDANPELQRLTENRVHSWNHMVVPDYLRTKNNPDVESEEIAIEQEKQSKQHDVIQKQIVNLNKHVDLLLTQLQTSEARAAAADLGDEKPTYNPDETSRLVRAVLCGEGLRFQRSVAPPPRPTSTVAQGQQQPVVPQHPQQHIRR